MTEIVNFLELNYIWFIIAGIIILLAVIGYYADKTNFWQGNTDDSNKNEGEQNLKDIGISDYANVGVANDGVDNRNTQINAPSNIVENKVDSQSTVFQNQIPNQNIENINNMDIVDQTKSNISSNNEKASILNEEQIIKFENEFNSILPKKDLISSDLLDDIDELKLDKTQKINLGDIKNLEDIELPDINGVEEEEIWKF